MFIFNSGYYKQTKGAHMESPISGLPAEFKYRPLKNNILKNIKLAPSTYIRYNYDISAVSDHVLQILKDFLEKINKIDNDIQFTMEIENKNKTLPLLDILLIKQGNKFNRKVYRKKVKLDHIMPNDARASMDL